MYLYKQPDKGMSRRTRDLLILAICVLLVLNAVQFFMSQTSVSRDSVVRDAFVFRVRAEVESARSAASQLSRLGGSSTIHLLAVTRQHLYGITQMNDMTATLLGSRQELVPQNIVLAAIRSVDACESKNMEGLPSDEPLAELQAYLANLSAAAELL